MARTLVLVLLAGCAPWKVVQRAEPSPLATEKTLSFAPLEWSEILIDGMPEQAWDQTNDEANHQQWPIDKQLAEGEFQRGLSSGLGSAVRLVPGAAPLTLKCSATYLSTGGFRPLILTVRAQILSGNGAVLDEITIERKETRNSLQVGQFRKRLLAAANVIGQGVGEYLRERAED
jgi:hypothetical protein